jgi:hypothetical protein
LLLSILFLNVSCCGVNTNLIVRFSNTQGRSESRASLIVKDGGPETMHAANERIIDEEQPLTETNDKETKGDYDLICLSHIRPLNIGFFDVSAMQVKEQQSNNY